MPSTTVPSAGSAAHSTPEPLPPILVREARERFADFIDEVAGLKGSDVEFQLSRTLLRLQDRANRASDGIEAAIRVLPNDTDADEARAVLELLGENARELSNDVTSTAALALFALSQKNNEALS